MQWLKEAFRIAHLPKGPKELYDVIRPTLEPLLEEGSSSSVCVFKRGVVCQMHAASGKGCDRGVIVAVVSRLVVKLLDEHIVAGWCTDFPPSREIHWT
jgi:hypothetical protein